ncbi:MAG: cation-translocating P-type ATPase [Erysipelotrichaceae bacterium]|nr:cation-translocating P-type ATPase [Erysipelotrichaceae bacterium]
MKEYQKTVTEVLEQVASQMDGLSSQEASKRLEAHGKNKLVESKKDPLWKRFLQELADPMILVLLAAALVSAITAVYANESFTDVIIILSVVILNAVLGVYQENKAEKAIEALNEMAASTSKVLRDGKVESVRSEDLTVGDVVMLEAGDAVPADGRILTSASLKIEESALTGESVPVNKSEAVIEEEEVPLGDRKNMVYMGSMVVYGRAEAVITQTGMDTEMGKIATVIANTKDGATPLQMTLARLSKVLTFLVLGICIFMFAFTLLRADSINGRIVLDTFMIAVSLAVAAIPEGLVAVVTIVLSIGVTNMSKQNAIIRKLTAVETLGCAQIICSDKTGTLTQNRMTVVDAYADQKSLLAKAMALCNDGTLEEDGTVHAEPTEAALVLYANSLQMPKYQLEKDAKRIQEVPFDSNRKMMSTFHQEGEKVMQYTKGAPDVLLSRCNYWLKDHVVVKLTESDRQQILNENKRMADQALRVLAAAYREYDQLPDVVDEQVEQDLIFIGLVGMIDPIRPEVLTAVNTCKEAGIRPIMITGDHKDTAVAIAKQLGILDEHTKAITGTELNKISDEELLQTIEQYAVYARVQPEHKVRIVNTWKKLGKVTAMTGDGVNDAPSIKNADIGIGMGITGTDVTKNVADMVLADDNFATIVSAVEEGRKIYDNIRKSIQFLLSSNLSEVVSIFVATLFGFTILKPVHILWINLITDSLPALGLGMEHAEADIMKRNPRDPKEGIFANGLGFDVAYQGVLVAMVTLISYFVGHYLESGVWEITSSNDGMTMAFLTLSMAEIFHSFNMRSQRQSIFNIKTHNKYLYLSMLASLLLTTAVIYVPALRNLFTLETISFTEYMVAIALAFLVIPVVEIVKFIQRKYQAFSRK